jgi:hypothetical protein
MEVFAFGALLVVGGQERADTAIVQTTSRVND